MKKGAILALAVLLLALIGVRLQMGRCVVTHELLTPDGAVFRFEGAQIMPGTMEQFSALQGHGLPPFEHVVQDIYSMPGALLKSTLTKPRVITLTVTTHGLTQKDLHKIQGKMNDALRHDRGSKAQQSIYRYTINGVSRDLYVTFDAPVTRSVGRYGLVEIVALRFLAWDPSGMTL